MSGDAVVVGIGMMTAVGVSTAETSASVRAATARFVETNLHGRRFGRFKIAEVPRDALPPLVDSLRDETHLSARETRMLRIASQPLRECLAAVGPGLNPGLCLALPENETAIPLDRSRFLARLSTQVQGAFRVDASDATHRGRAGGIIAVGQAVETIRQGVTDFVIAGGIDTYRDLYVLATLDRDQRVLSRLNLDAFIPGEGACFLLIANSEAAKSRGVPALAKLSQLAMGFEDGHLNSSNAYRGEGLANTLQQLIRQVSLASPVANVYSSMNGESYWAKEWGVSSIRARAILSDKVAIHHPADCFGDTGAAAGPLMIGLASHGIVGSYRRGPALVYGSSDYGQRAAMIVTDNHSVL